MAPRDAAAPTRPRERITSATGQTVVVTDSADDPDEPCDEEFDTPIPPRKSASTAAPILAGMMLAVGEILEPEKTKVEIAVEHSKPIDDQPFELGFGDLPPLE